MDIKYDLHVHTTASDGTNTPLEVLDLAAEAGLGGLSITDHDTVAAYTDVVFAHAAKLGLKLGPGVEFSAKHNGHSVHVLGYAIDVKNKCLLEFCQKHQDRRYRRNLAMCQKLEKMGMSVGDGWLLDDAGVPIQGIGRPHIAKKMVTRGFVKDIKSAFSKYLGDGKCAFVESPIFSVEETIDLIHSAGGKAFIAHPQLCKRNRLLKEILKLNFDGLECYYGGFGHFNAKHWLDIAEEKNWMISGGSDYHGDIKPETRIGSSYVTQEAFENIFRL